MPGSRKPITVLPIHFRTLKFLHTPATFTGEWPEALLLYHRIGQSLDLKCVLERTHSHSYWIVEQKSSKPNSLWRFIPSFCSDIPAMLSFEFLQHEVYDELQLADMCACTSGEDRVIVWYSRLERANPTTPPTSHIWWSICPGGWSVAHIGH